MIFDTCLKSFRKTNPFHNSQPFDYKLSICALETPKMKFVECVIPKEWDFFVLRGAFLFVQRLTVGEYKFAGFRCSVVILCRCWFWDMISK